MASVECGQTILLKEISMLQSKFSYASYEHIQLEKTRDMVVHGNYGYALTLAREYTFTEFKEEWLCICFKLEHYLNN